MTKAYIVGQINITNMEEYKKYAEKVFDIVLASGILTYVPDTYRLLDSITKVSKLF